MNRTKTCEGANLPLDTKSSVQVLACTEIPGKQNEVWHVGRLLAA